MDLPLSVTEIGSIVAFIAPGYLAQLGYRAKFPNISGSSTEVLLKSVVISLPFVALAHRISPDGTASDLSYVALLLGPAFAAGYVAAWVRGHQEFKDLLATVGITLQPEGTIYAQTLQKMGDSDAVVIDFVSGKQLYGNVQRGPNFAADGVQELYVTYPRWLTDEGWAVADEKAVIVRLAEVASISLSTDPCARREPLVDLEPPLGEIAASSGTLTQSSRTRSS